MYFKERYSFNVIISINGDIKKGFSKKRRYTSIERYSRYYRHF